MGAELEVSEVSSAGVAGRTSSCESAVAVACIAVPPASLRCKREQVAYNDSVARRRVRAHCEPKRGVHLAHAPRSTPRA